MYKDIISYELAEGISQEQLLQVAAQVVEGWMKNQPGFIKWEICKDKDGNYKDIVYWESKEAADNSTKDMANVPNAAAWFACYKEGSISSINLTRISEF